MPRAIASSPTRDVGTARRGQRGDGIYPPVVNPSCPTGSLLIFLEATYHTTLPCVPRCSGALLELGQLAPLVCVSLSLSVSYEWCAGLLGDGLARPWADTRRWTNRQRARRSLLYRYSPRYLHYGSELYASTQPAWCAPPPPLGCHHVARITKWNLRVYTIQSINAGWRSCRRSSRQCWSRRASDAQRSTALPAASPLRSTARGSLIRLPRPGCWETYEPRLKNRLIHKTDERDILKNNAKT